MPNNNFSYSQLASVFDPQKDCYYTDNFFLFLLQIGVFFSGLFHTLSVFLFRKILKIFYVLFFGIFFVILIIIVCHLYIYKKKFSSVINFIVWVFMNHLRSLKINLIRFKSLKNFLNCIKYIFVFKKCFKQF